MAGVGAIEPGSGLNIVGTSEVILATVDKPILTKSAMVASIDVGPHVHDGKYLVFGSMPSAGSVVEWLARLISGNDRSRALSGIYEETIAEALSSREAPGCSPLVLPDFTGSHTPYGDHTSRAAIVGLDLNTTRGQLFLGFLERLSSESAQVVDTLESLLNFRLGSFWGSGGASKNSLWTNTKAYMCGRDIRLTKIPEIWAFGTAVLAAYGAGLYPTLEDAVGQMSVEFEVVSHDAGCAKPLRGWHRDTYASLYSLLQGANRTASSRDCQEVGE